MAQLLLVFTVLFWVGNSVMARAIHLEFPPVSLAASRWTLAMLILLPFVLPRIRREWAVIRANWPIILLLSILGVSCFNTLIYTGLQTTTATNTTLMHSMIPVLILIISRVFLHHAISLRQWVGVTLSLCGVLVLLSKASIATLLSLEFNRGDLWVFVAVADWALYSVLLRYKPAELSGMAFLGITITLGALVLWLPALLELSQGRMPELSLHTGATVLYMAIFPSILAYMCWNRGVAELGAPVAGLFIHLMPLFGLLMSVIFLGEQVQAFHFIGIALIFGGIFLAVVTDTLRNLRPTKTQESSCKS
jgi:drug/metabolite transporter (DMT)-like permease